MPSLETSCFDSLPVISFYNKATETRNVWVCENMTVAVSRAAGLDELGHIEDVQIMDAIVCRGEPF